MRIAFRTDASIRIGNGHVMRCLTLADALRDRGASCTFFCRAHDGHLIEYVTARGHQGTLLPARKNDELNRALETGHAAWLGTSWEDDATETIRAIDSDHPDWLVVDHYALDERWERAMRPRCRRIMAIDDLADRPHHCELLLDQNLGRKTSDYEHLIPADAIALTGPRYALLRPGFAQRRSESLARRVSPDLKTVLLNMGGVDKDNVTSLVLKTMSKATLPADTRVIVVMGPHAPWQSDVRTLAGQMPFATQVLVGVSDMAGLMTTSDLAIGAAGSTAWERCCLGLPTIQLVLADNQAEAAVALAQCGAAIGISSIDSIASELPRALHKMQHDHSVLHHLSRRAADICDGLGTASVAAHLLDVSGVNGATQ
ncbi:UDP-2,4-diacetamido-2,4,6-trideoxy-beta-L-altropyranose hydrolase [Propionivibrio dicarboxylicus]|uniref:UDP-2,4-diacetamido-2,4,6-trideoxy-beta-L-altropyranose hydrolase n=1 Tax=Propionivibrio dicarboxylicus TaxID=83767 RepID=A0A1G8DXH2_9RHOO|nr:UDP-2,4-diacetamido-2,4,6-trideoxy-beta-L-altropyranose hydrolase [Propionivibrio dicarboxylicus]SDH62160.1 UDP-2,4-diacetamido-2,4,6-trideoxy-beta-L-altropyranose hydrolase [Propionivibrio dicarboxylicus]